jgi:hypothetical protein
MDANTLDDVISVDEWVDKTLGGDPSGPNDAGDDIQLNNIDGADLQVPIDMLKPDNPHTGERIKIVSGRAIDLNDDPDTEGLTAELKGQTSGGADDEQDAPEVDLDDIDAAEDNNSDEEEVEDDDIDDTLDDEDELKAMRKNMTNPDYYKINTVVPPNERITSDIMTLAEFSEVRGIRAKEISMTQIVFTDTGGLTNPRAIATKELYDRKCPLEIIRHISATEVEVWSCNEMGFPADLRTSF